MTTMEKLSKAARIRARHYVDVKRETATLADAAALMQKHGVDRPGEAMDAEATLRAKREIAKRHPTTAKRFPRLCQALEDMTVGRTKIINGEAVTRWTANSYEIGTWGNDTISFRKAVKVLAVAL